MYGMSFDAAGIPVTVWIFGISMGMREKDTLGGIFVSWEFLYSHSYYKCHLIIMFEMKERRWTSTFLVFLEKTQRGCFQRAINASLLKTKKHFQASFSEMELNKQVSLFLGNLYRKALESIKIYWHRCRISHLKRHVMRYLIPRNIWWKIIINSCDNYFLNNSRLLRKFACVSSVHSEIVSAVLFILRLCSENGLNPINEKQNL